MRRIAQLLIPGLMASIVALATGMTAPAQAASDIPPLAGTGPRVVVRTAMPGTMTDVRLGRHADYDRIVFQLDGALPGWDVRYVPLVHADGSGLPVPVSGKAALRVVMHGVNGHDEQGRPTVTRVASSPRWPALRQVRPAGDFEAVMTFALGVSDRLDFRVFALAHPTRVVVDIAHPVSHPFVLGATQVWAPPGGGGDATLAGIRVGVHPGYSRVVLDLPGNRLRPNVGTAYGNPMEALPPTALVTRLWTFGHPGGDPDPQLRYAGPRVIRVGLANLGSISVRSPDPSTIDVIAWTRARHGYRMFVVPGAGMTRVVIDIAR